MFRPGLVCHFQSLNSALKRVIVGSHRHHLVMMMMIMIDDDDDGDQCDHKDSFRFYGTRLEQQPITRNAHNS